MQTVEEILDQMQSLEDDILSLDGDDGGFPKLKVYELKLKSLNMRLNAAFKREAVKEVDSAVDKVFEAVKLKDWNCE